MSEDDVDRLDRNRRHFLTVATAVTGLVGVGGHRNVETDHLCDPPRRGAGGVDDHGRIVSTLIGDDTSDFAAFGIDVF